MKALATKHLSTIQVKSSKCIWEHIDKDNSGSIDMHELKLAFQSLGISKDHEEIEKAFHCMDIDKNG